MAYDEALADRIRDVLADRGERSRPIKKGQMRGGEEWCD